MNKIKYFGTDGIRGKVGGIIMNPDFIKFLGLIIGNIFTENKIIKNRKIGFLIGKDTRLSSNLFETSLINGLLNFDVYIILSGIIPTSAISYLTYRFRLNFGIVISASHNTYEYNGIKFFSYKGKKISSSLKNNIEQKIKKLIHFKNNIFKLNCKKLKYSNEYYINFCRRNFPKDLSLKNIKIIIDSANGSSYHVSSNIFKNLGAKVYKIGHLPDGFNINKNFGTINSNYLKLEIFNKKADFGISFDGDADRLSVIDSNLREYNGDELLYTIIKERIKNKIVTGVVGTKMTNYGLECKLNNLKIPFKRVNVGDHYIFEKLQKLGWIFGGEGSGHLLFLDRHFTGDGIISSLQILTTLIRSKKKLSCWVNDIKMYYQYSLNISLPSYINWKININLLNILNILIKKLKDKGRVIVRQSGTEPKLRIMSECRSKYLSKKSILQIYNKVKKEWY